MPRHRQFLALGALLLATGADAAPARLVPLFVIPTDSKVSTPVPNEAPLRVQIESRNPALLARLLGSASPAAGATSVEYVFDGAERIPPVVAGRTWLEPTFVIDHDEAHVVALRDEYKASHAGPPTAASLVEFVAGKVQVSGDQRFALASRVATLLRGDCSEHAVLTTALARAVGLPARVVLGLAVVNDDGQFGAFGHAWAVVLDGGRWVVADAALAGAKLDVRYLPVAWLDDEGPGFMMQVIDPMSSWATHVTVLGIATPSSREKTP